MHKNSKFPKKIIGAKFGRETHRAENMFHMIFNSRF